MFIAIVVVCVLGMTALLAATGGSNPNSVGSLLKGGWQASEVFTLLFAGLALGGGVGVVLALGILRSAQ